MHDRIYHEEVNLYVGPNRVLFQVYLKHLWVKIDFFDDLFTGDDPDGTHTFEDNGGELAAMLYDFDEDAFELLLDWVRTDEPLLLNPGCIALSRFYALADQLRLKSLMDEILEATIKNDLEQKELSIPYVDDMTTYCYLPKGSPFRKYICMGIAHMFQDQQMSIAHLRRRLLCDEFCLDFLAVIQKGEPVSDPRDLPIECFK